jgi:hypothetical protein
MNERVNQSTGVNEMQSVANAAGSTEIQTLVNRNGLMKMRKYADKFIAFYDQNSLTPQSSYSSYNKLAKPEMSFVELKSMIISLLNTLANLIEEENKNRGKIVDLLLVSCYAARLLNAARTTSCKSAKDRTSVFHSLEVTRLIERAGWIDRFSLAAHTFICLKLFQIHILFSLFCSFHHPFLTN